MLSPWQWAALAAVPPAIVALYFLKLRRQPLQVPSTYLWQKSIEDLHVNSLWQRLRQSLLLLLQLLLVALLMLALVNPSWQGTRLSGDRFVFLVDNSASMSATDVKDQGVPTRLDLAKRRVSELIGNMKSGDKAMLISFSDTGQVVQEYTTNPAELRRRLATIQPTQRTTSLTEALRLAAGLANAARSAASRPEEKPHDVPAGAATSSTTTPSGGLPATLVVLSDFRFPDVPDVPLGNLTPKFELIGKPEADNVAITMLATRRYEDRPEELQVVGRIENFSSQEKTLAVELLRDGRLDDTREIKIPAGGRQTVPFPSKVMESGVFSMHIKAPDDLAVDNEAWAVVNPPHRGRVLFVSPGDEPLRRALGTAKAHELADIRIEAPAFLTTKEYTAATEGGAFDLVIYDQCAPKTMPPANTLFIGRLPPDGRWQQGATLGDPKIIDTERTHPLTQLIEVGDFVIAEAKVVRPPPGGVSLFEAAEGSLFAIAPREGFEDAVLGFEIFATDAQGQRVANTNWPLRQSFPLFIHEMLGYLGSGAARLETDSLRPGQSLTWRAEGAAEAVQVVAPGDHKITLPPQENQTLQFSGTDAVGVYEIHQGQRPVRRFAVNLFSAAESDIRTQPEHSLRLGHSEVRPATHWESVRVAVWKPLLLLALAVLLLEWYIYNRRVYL
ncbi:MAG: BatA and WFA domain-containing protein [Planctomycetia bacterium]|nr:BatA and WFA domain-containing protein [Planctomycetia bacterium]